MLLVLRKICFGERWIKWVEWCISIVKFSIMVNGSPTIFFQRSKGLRQGDPFSPYLFVIAMEVFSCLLKRAERRLFVWVEGWEAMVLGLFYSVRRKRRGAWVWCAFLQWTKPSCASGIGVLPMKVRLFGSKSLIKSMEKMLGVLRSHEVWERYDIGLWKTIRKVWGVLSSILSFQEGNGQREILEGQVVWWWASL